MLALFSSPASLSRRAALASCFSPTQVTVFLMFFFKEHSCSSLTSFPSPPPAVFPTLQGGSGEQRSPFGTVCAGRPGTPEAGRCRALQDGSTARFARKWPKQLSVSGTSLFVRQCRVPPGWQTQPCLLRRGPFPQPSPLARMPCSAHPSAG